MGKVTVGMFVSVDGIIEEPMWTMPFWADEKSAERLGTYKDAELFEADALLLGRKTYEGFAASWPDHPEHGAYKDRMNAMPKHVATTTLTGELEWNATAIAGDVAEAVRKLRADKNLLVMGSRPLIDYLRDHKLIDEYRLAIFPILLGKGDRLFNQTDVEATTELAESEILENGVILATYQVTEHEVSRPDFGPDGT